MSPRLPVRCCDAGSGVARLSPCVSQSDAVTPAPGLCLPLVSLCLPVSRLLPVRCCDAGSGVVSPACLPVSPSLSLVFLCLPVRCVSPTCLAVSPSPSLASLCLPVRCCDAGSGLPLVSLCLPVSRLSACVSPSDAVTPAPGSCLRLPPGIVSLASLPILSRAKPTEAASSLRVLGLTLLAASFCLVLTAQQGPGQNQLKLLLLCVFWG